MKAGPGLLALVVLSVSACSVKKPANTYDSCELFDDKRKWYKYTRKSYRKWGTPIGVQLSFIYQESGFRHNAKAPRRKLLWVIPWKRKSSAFGYGQVVKRTWKTYKRETGRRWADRDEFKYVVDFIGWYNDKSHRKLGIDKKDAYNLYLAYHEGHGGYARRSYRRKRWLMRAARQVQRRARRYERQLRRCESKLRRKRFLGIF